MRAYFLGCVCWLALACSAGGSGPTAQGGSPSAGAPAGGTSPSGGMSSGGSAAGMVSGGAGQTSGGAGAGAGAGAGSAGGGAGNAGSGVGGGSGGSAASGCDSAALCDHFEGSMAAGWAVQPDSVPPPELDATKGANGSASSLKVTGTSSQAFLTYAVPGQAFYVRAYMNFEQSTATSEGHGWFIVGADNVTQGGGAQMRFGASGNHGHREIDFNVYNGGCTGEKTQFSDGASDGLAGWTNVTQPVTLFEANQWYCVEAYFNGTGNEFQLWVDEAEVPGLHVTEASMCPSWSPTYTHVKIGAGANANIGAIWYDDVAISTTRVHCE